MDGVAMLGLRDVEDLTGVAVYVVVIGIVFVESGLLVGFFLPGDTVLFAAGLVAANPGSGVDLVPLVVGIVVAAVLGDSVGYAFGRRAGRPLLSRRDGRVLNAANLSRAEAFYDRFGMAAVVVARWIPWVRTFTPILAGVSEMPYRRFLAANLAGAVCWGAGLTVLGYLAADAPGVRGASLAVAAAVVTVSTVLGLLRWRPAQRAAEGTR